MPRQMPKTVRNPYMGAHNDGSGAARQARCRADAPASRCYRKLSPPRHAAPENAARPCGNATAVTWMRGSPAQIMTANRYSVRVAEQASLNGSLTPQPHLLTLSGLGL